MLCTTGYGRFPSVSFLRPSSHVTAVVTVDNASGFVALKEDITLINLKIELDYGRQRNKNKDPVVVRNGITEVSGFRLQVFLLKVKLLYAKKN